MCIDISVIYSSQEKRQIVNTTKYFKKCKVCTRLALELKFGPGRIRFLALVTCKRVRQTSCLASSDGTWWAKKMYLNE